MKKLIALSAIVVGSMMASQANAAAFGFQSGSQLITPTNCPALSNNITVQLSNNVIAAMDCDATSFVAATCSDHGLLKNQNFTCLYDANNAPLSGFTGCGAPGSGTNGADPTVNLDSRTAYRGTSNGGRVGATPLGVGVGCSTTDLVTLTPASMLVSGTSAATAP
jgi:hypothetical protein